jgi:hypothetical protein
MTSSLPITCPSSAAFQGILGFPTRHPCRRPCSDVKGLQPAGKLLTQAYKALLKASCLDVFGIDKNAGLPPSL